MRFMFLQQHLSRNRNLKLGFFISLGVSLSLLLRPLSSSVSPALGLTWANQVTVRLMMMHSHAMISRDNQNSALRRLEVVFGPHLARSGAHFALWREGVRGVVRCDRTEP